MDRFSASGGQSVVAAGTETALVLTAPSGRIVCIKRVRVSQATHGTSEQYGLQVQRASAAGSGGASVTPSPLEANGGASGVTLSKNPTVEPTATVTLLDVRWNSLVGRDIILDGGSEIWVAPSAHVMFVVTSYAAATTFTPQVEIEFEEIG